jgi:effector-binding domain-containing protein
MTRLIIACSALGLMLMTACSGTTTQQDAQASAQAPSSDYAIEMQTVESQPTAVVRVQVTPQEIGPKMGELIGKVAAFLGQKGFQPTGPAFSLYHSFTPDSVDMEVGFPVPSPIEQEGDIQPGTLPGGSAAVTMHVGPYDKLHAAHAALQKWITDNGKTSGGPTWEIYLTDPTTESDPNNYQTRVFVPLATE